VSGRCTGWVLKYGPHPDDVHRDGKKYGQRARGYRAVLLTIGDAANSEGEHAHPGVAAMCTGSLYSRRQVQSIEDELVAEGWVTITEQGGGRGRATVYKVNMEWRNAAGERAQPAPGSPAEKGAASATETVQPDDQSVQPGAETVQPGVHPNGVPTVEPNGNDPTAAADGDDEEPDEAREIVTAYWDWCKEHERPTPTLPTRGNGNAFMALVKIVGKLLEAGWPRPAIKRALIDTPAYTLDSLTFTLNSHRPPGAPAVEPRRDGPSGRLEL